MTKPIPIAQITPHGELEELRAQLLEGKHTKKHGRRIELAPATGRGGQNSQCSMAWHLMAVRRRCTSPVAFTLHYIAALKATGNGKVRPRPWLELSYSLLADLSGIGVDAVISDVKAMEAAGLIKHRARRGRPGLIKVLRSPSDLARIEQRYWREIDAVKVERKIRKRRKFIRHVLGENLLPIHRKKAKRRTKSHEGHR